MADVHEPSTRSYNMSRIRSKNTKPELIVRRFLHKSGLRYRLHDMSLPGNPNIKLTKFKTIVNVHGCFWHCHENCNYFRFPKSNTDYWDKKLHGNKERDKINTQKLLKLGWEVITFWECELKKNPLVNLESLYQEITSNIK